jgi:16S rRNA G966 N2-methylase RsmD
VGIEALSLGASFAHFVEVSRDAVTALEANLVLCGAPPGSYHVHRARVADVLTCEPNPMGNSSIIYADPPYGSNLDEEFFHNLDPARFPNLRIVVVEHRTKQRIVPQLSLRGSLSLRCSNERRFGDTTLTYLVPASPAEEG